MEKINLSPFCIPVAMHYYQRAASLGEPKGALNIRDTFRDGDFQYNKDEKIANEYSKILRRLQDEPGLQIPNLAKDHPLPPHPVQGYHADKDINWIPTGRADDY